MKYEKNDFVELSKNLERDTNLERERETHKK